MDYFTQRRFETVQYFKKWNWNQTDEEGKIQKVSERKNNTIVRQSHTKSRKICITENIKQYSISAEISLEEKRLLFQVRKMMCDVKTNYKTKYSHNMRCRLCDQQEKSESH